jgi:hypothetical protein
MMYNNTLTCAAKEYSQAGLSVIPTKADKSPLMNWRFHQTYIMSDEEIDTAFQQPSTQSISVIGGDVSGGLEVIDVDCKYDLTGKLWEDLDSLISKRLPEFHSQMVVAKTIGGGYHIFFKCAKPEGNQKLASRPITQEEREIILAENFHKGKSEASRIARKNKTRTLIETRGEGGYVLVYPSKGYQMLRGSLLNIPKIDETTRQRLFEIARSFEYKEKDMSFLFDDTPEEPQEPQEPVDRPKRYRLPIAITSWALKTENAKLLPTFLIMKDWSSGHLRMNTEQVYELCALAGISLKKFYSDRKKLLELNWIGYNKEKALYHIRSWDYIMKYLRLEGKSNIGVEQKDFKTIRALCFAADLGHFVKTRKKLAEDTSRGSKQVAKDHPVLNEYSNETGETSHYSKLGVVYLGERYGVYASTISKWKKEAKEAGYLDYEHHYAPLNVPENSRSDLEVSMKKVSHKIVGYLGMLYIQLTDSFLVNMKYFTLG